METKDLDEALEEFKKVIIDYHKSHPESKRIVEVKKAILDSILTVTRIIKRGELEKFEKM